MRQLIPYLATRSFNSDFFRDMDRLFDDFTAPAASTYDERGFSPASEVVETDDHYLLSVDLPGLKKEDIHVDLVENTLTISGERKRDGRNGTERVQRTERSFTAFKKSFVLPSSVTADRIEAKYADGVLELYLPKSQLAQSRRIEIQSGKGSFFDNLLGAKKSEKETSREI